MPIYPAMRNRIARYFEFEFPKDEPTNLLGVGFALGMGWFIASALVQLWVFMLVKFANEVGQYLH